MAADNHARKIFNNLGWKNIKSKLYKFMRKNDRIGQVLYVQWCVFYPFFGN